MLENTLALNEPRGALRAQDAVFVGILETNSMNGKAIAIGGALCGVLDITEAFCFYGWRGIPPDAILRSIAAGLLGPAAHRGGAGTAVMGLLLHFLIAFTAAAVYVFLWQRFAVLRKRWVISGTLYGLAVYAVMYGIVLPLSAMPPVRYTTVGVLNQLFAHTVCVGLPIAWAAQRYGGIRQRSNGPAQFS